MNFLSLNFLDILDVLIVTLILVYLYKAIRGSSAYYIFAGIFFIYILWIVVRFLKMELMTMLLGQVLGVGVIALIIVFQQEVRRFLLFLLNKYIKRFNKMKFIESSTHTVDEILNSCQSMSEGMTGALIVITKTDSLSSIVNTGDTINADVSGRLLETIFFKNSPLHDGAVIITDDKIIAARCLLPTTDDNNVPAYYGTRHRAAIGVSENSDALVVVVSEQTGKISFVENGIIERGLTILQLKDKLMKGI
ncbi:MAG: diadenylate cyclase CdaA [Rikenellaceae bacterium]